MTHRDVQDSIDKRNAAVMDLEHRHRLAVAALEKIVVAEAVTYDQECRFLKDIAREALAKVRK